MINQIRIVASLIFLLLIPHCSSYKINYHEDGQNAQLSSAQTIENVTLQTEILVDDQINAIFKKNLRNSGYQPLAITISNRTSNTLLFRSSYTSLPLISSDVIAQELHYSVPLTTAGLFTIGYIGFQLFWPLAPFMITALPMGWQSYKENQKITERIQNVSLPVDEREMLEIPPFTKIYRFAFVPLEPYYHFEFQLFDSDNKKLIPFVVYLYN